MGGENNGSQTDNQTGRETDGQERTGLAILGLLHWLAQVRIRYRVSWTTLLRIQLRRVRLFNFISLQCNGILLRSPFFPSFTRLVLHRSPWFLNRGLNLREIVLNLSQGFSAVCGALNVEHFGQPALSTTHPWRHHLEMPARSACTVTALRGGG